MQCQAFIYYVKIFNGVKPFPFRLKVLQRFYSLNPVLTEVTGMEMGFLKIYGSMLFFIKDKGYYE